MSGSWGVIGGGELRVDTGALQESAHALKMIAIDFSSGDTVINHLVDAVGHGQGTGDLRHEIQQFSSSWDARRAKMREGIEGLQGFTEMAAEEFVSADRQLASQLEGDNRPPSMGDYTPGAHASQGPV